MGFFFNGGFEILFFLVFFLILGVIIITLFQNLRRWSRNNNSPRLSVHAVVAAKRTQVGSAHYNNGSGAAGVNRFTRYFVTFQVDSGDRMELEMEGGQYGLLIEGDIGMLSFQGTRFLSFERE